MKKSKQEKAIEDYVKKFQKRMEKDLKTGKPACEVTKVTEDGRGFEIDFHPSQFKGFEIYSVAKYQTRTRNIYNPNTQLGKIYKYLSSRRGRWVSGGEIARAIPTTCPSTYISAIRQALINRDEHIEVKRFTGRDGKQSWSYRIQGNL